MHERAIRDGAAVLRRARSVAQQVGCDDAEVVVGDVGELHAARHVAHGPDIVGRGSQVFVHLDSAAVVQFDAGGFQVEAGRVRGAADRDQHGMAGIALLLAVHLGEHQHLIVFVVDARHVRVVHDGDAAVFQAFPHGFGRFGILVGEDGVAVL